MHRYPFWFAFSATIGNATAAVYVPGLASQVMFGIAAALMFMGMIREILKED